MEVNHQNNRNFLLWLDPTFDESNEDHQDKLRQLQTVTNEVILFTKIDECIDYLTEMNEKKAFLLMDDIMAHEIMPLIHDIPQLDSIFLVCRALSSQVDWSKLWFKVKKIHTEMKSISIAIHLIARNYEENSMSPNFLCLNEGNSAIDLNQLEPLFMYTQIFKEILMEIQYDPNSIKDFTAYCQSHDYGSVTNLNKFENEYEATRAIWWYTSPSFIFSLVNRSLRMMEADSIIHIGFFIRDLHCQIEQLYLKQVADYHNEPFTVYRGQALSTTDFEKLLKNKGGLISFNNFLSTSKSREISFVYSQTSLTLADTVGILFRISIDPKISSTPFAAIQEVSYFQEEKEVLFSMHTIFRIGEIKRIDNNNLLYQVKLQLTPDNDPQLLTLTEYLRHETVSSFGWNRLAALLVKIGQFNKAEDIYINLLKQVSTPIEKTFFCNQLGYIKEDQGDHPKAMDYYQQSAHICETLENLPLLATIYNNISMLYNRMGDSTKALTFSEKAMTIFESILSPYSPVLATLFNNIGSMYFEMGDYERAFSFHKKALKIRQQTLSQNHPHLAVSYNSLSALQWKMGEHQKAIEMLEKAIDIIEKSLPPNHPQLLNYYSNITVLYSERGDYQKALSLNKKILQVQQEILCSNHPDLATSYNNIGIAYNHLGDNEKALSFLEQALQIRQQIFHPNHLTLATSYTNIGAVYTDMKEYKRALEFHEKALQIEQQVLALDHPDLATSYSNIGEIYCQMQEQDNALIFHQKALEIREKIVPTNQRALATSYNNIGLVYYEKGEYFRALTFYEKANPIFEGTLVTNHLQSAAFYNNISAVFMKTGEYSKALELYKKALIILEKTLPSNHSYIETVRQGIESAKEKISNRSDILHHHFATDKDRNE